VVVAAILGVAACGEDAVAPLSPPPPPPDDRSTLNIPGSPTNLDARTSQNKTGGTPVSVFDDFTFTGGSTIRNIAWQGIYCREVLNAGAPVPIATSFTVSFHADNGGLPNPTALQSETIPLAQVAETFDQNSVLECGTTSTTWGFYNYSATMTTPFVAAAGTRYWVSVVANLPATDLFWGWRNGTVDNNNSVQLFQGAFTNYNLDRAYELKP